MCSMCGGGGRKGGQSITKPACCQAVSGMGYQMARTKCLAAASRGALTGERPERGKGPLQAAQAHFQVFGGKGMRGEWEWVPGGNGCGNRAWVPFRSPHPRKG